ncbi:MAG: hypothetical protein LKM40_06455 [Mageeibacillus sp.]|nr:hypothetical protein [Mageeibacillus sp.]
MPSRIQNPGKITIHGSVDIAAIASLASGAGLRGKLTCIMLRQTLKSYFVGLVGGGDTCLIYLSFEYKRILSCKAIYFMLAFSIICPIDGLLLQWN